MNTKLFYSKTSIKNGKNIFLAVALFFEILTVTGCFNAKVCEKIKPIPGPYLNESLKEENFGDLVAYYLNYYVSAEANLSIDYIENKDSGMVELMAVEKREKGILFLRAHELRFFSKNALQGSVKVNLTLEVEVINKNKTRVYQKTIVGHYVEQDTFRILNEKSSEKLIKGVVRDALEELTQDPGLKKIIAKYRYGAFGIVATMF